MDPLSDEAVKIVCQYDRVSASLLQCKLDIGYARASRILDTLEEIGVIGSREGSKPGDVLIRSYKEFEKNKETLLSRVKDYTDTGYLPPTYYPPRFEPGELGFTPKPFEAPVGLLPDGNILTMSLDNLGQLLVIGAPQSRKMDFLETIIVSQLLSSDPSKIKLILADDFKRFNLFNCLPHLLTPAIDDSSKILSALKWTIMEMDRRRKLFNEAKVKDCFGYLRLKPESLPRILVVLKFNAKIGKDTRDAIQRISTGGTDLGVYMVLAVDLATTDYLPKEIRSNFLFTATFTMATNAKLKIGIDELMLKAADEEIPHKLKILTLPERWPKIVATMTTPPDKDSQSVKSSSGDELCFVQGS